MKAQKPGLHPRNRHQQRYDLPALCQAHPELQGFITLNPVGGQTIDFANPLAVKALNKALLAHFYAVKYWDIPDGFLCPPVPGRADYIHHLADLLALDSGTIPANASILDIGVGANCIYPLIGVHEYGWRFTGSEVNADAFASAQAIVNGNPGLTRQIRLRRQKDAKAILTGIIHKNETYDATLCNPPFHDSAASAQASATSASLRSLPRVRIAAAAVSSRKLDTPEPGAPVTLYSPRCGRATGHSRTVFSRERGTRYAFGSSATGGTGEDRREAMRQIVSLTPTRGSFAPALLSNVCPIPHP